MKAMSLRIRMQTLSPCLTPSLCNPPAMRAARSAISAWLRWRSPEMMPRVREDVSIVLPILCRLPIPHGEERVSASRTMRPCCRLRPIPRDAASRLLGMRIELSRFREPRRALVDVGADGLGLVRTADQLLLLDGFGKQRRAGI